MHQLGLKLWSSNSFYIKPAMDLYRDGIFDYVELFVVPGTEKEHLHKWKQTRFPFFLHAPHSDKGFNFSSRKLEERNRDLIKEVVNFQKALNPQQVIFHPGVEGALEETIRQVRIFENEFQSLFDIALIENKPQIGLKDEICVGAAPAEIQQIVEETGLGFCLDIGHAICYAAWKQIGYKDVINQFLKSGPKVFHLSDGNKISVKDRHEHLGDGNFDLSQILKMIPDNTSVTVETKKDSEFDLDDFAKDISYLKGLNHG